ISACSEFLVVSNELCFDLVVAGFQQCVSYNLKLAVADCVVVKGRFPTFQKERIAAKTSTVRDNYTLSGLLEDSDVCGDGERAAIRFGRNLARDALRFVIVDVGGLVSGQR